jgi:hypothetical protein
VEPEVLGSKQLMKKILKALESKEPLSVISIGATESYVMAQYTVLSEEQFMNHKEAISTNSGQKLRGFQFPNVNLRDQMVKAAREADIIGYNMHLRSMKAGLMTEMVFKAYDINPDLVFEALIRRVIFFSQKKMFKEMLRNRRTVLIGNIAHETKGALISRWGRKFSFEIADCIPMRSFNEMDMVKKTLDRTKYDLCLMCAGVNSVILGPYIAKKHGKVAFDLGQGMTSLITNEVRNTGFVKRVGINKLKSL